MKILFVYGDYPREHNSSEWRMIIPARAMLKTGHHVNTMHFETFIEQSPESFIAAYSSDVIVYERVLTGGAAAVLKKFKDMGKVIVFDMDDGYEFLPNYTVSYNTWHVGGINGVPLLQSLKDNISIFHAVTVPSKRLAELWQNYANTIVVPNYPNLQEEMWSKSVNVKIPGVVGWGGTSAHLESFRGSGAGKALRNMERFMIFCSNNSILNLFPKAIKMPIVSFDEWPRMITNFSVGIAPVSGRYDECRSNIKVLEYACRGVPWIASNSPVYEGCVGGVFVENSQNEWKRNIEHLLHDESMWSDLSQKGFDWAQGMDINLHIKERVEIYEGLRRQYAK